MNKTVLLKDREGNNIYPKTPITNIIGLTPGLDNRHIFFGSGVPSNTKSIYEGIEINDLYINTNSNRDAIFYRVSSFYQDNTRISWDLYGYYFMKSGTPPTTGQDWSIAFGRISPYPRKGLLWCDTNTGHIYEFIGEPNDLRWRCLTDNYSKSELDAMLASFQTDIDEKADRIEVIKQTTGGQTLILEDSSEIKIPEITIFGKSTQNGVPSIDNPVNIVDTTSETIGISEVGGSGSQYKSLSKILRGIPVQSGGNYTDNNNQQWICDTIEKYEDGSGKYIQRVGYVTGSQIASSASGWYGEETTQNKIIGFQLANQPACSFPLKTYGYSTYFSIGSVYGDRICYAIGGAQQLSYLGLIFGFGLNSTLTFEERKSFVQNLTDDFKVIYPLYEYIETPLTADELAQLDLSTYYPITNITSNPAIKITYVADTKNYFDKKIEQIQNAIISNGGNV